MAVNQHNIYICTKAYKRKICLRHVLNESINLNVALTTISMNDDGVCVRENYHKIVRCALENSGIGIFWKFLETFFSNK